MTKKAKVWQKQEVDFAENIANEQCAMTPPPLWAGDITYIPTDEGWLYLAIFIDWFSRLIVSWEVSDTPDSRLCIQALQLAIHRRNPPSDVIFHYKSRVGKCTDNTVIERFFRSLETEKLNGYLFKTRE